MITNAEYLMHRLLEKGIKPHAEAIARIAATGGIAVVVWEVDESNLRKLLRAEGWRPSSPVFPMTPRMKAALDATDFVTCRWLKMRSDLCVTRLFVVVRDGTLLVNYTPSEGFSLEPGSTDRERAVGAN